MVESVNTSSGKNVDLSEDQQEQTLAKKRKTELADLEHQVKMSELQAKKAKSDAEKKALETQGEKEKIEQEAMQAQIRKANAETKLLEQQTKQGRLKKIFKQVAAIGSAAVIGTGVGYGWRASQPDGEKLPDGMGIRYEEGGKCTVDKIEDMEKAGRRELCYYDGQRLVHTGKWVQGEVSKVGKKEVVVMSKDDVIGYNSAEKAAGNFFKWVFKKGTPEK